ncbi:MAG: PKD domain-containing protein [Cytophagales bacterium]|nr:MAG: PKD domain-containing protein [Cytophagales bacterium]
MEKQKNKYNSNYSQVMKNIFIKLLLFSIVFFTIKNIEAKEPKPLAVTITAPSLTGLCIGNLSYVTLGNIVITENNNGDISNGANETITLTAPAGIEFQAGTGSGSVSGTGATFGSVVVTNSTITFTASLSGGSNSNINTITINGINVRATSLVSSVTLTRTGGTMTIAGFANADVAATFSSTAIPVAPVITGGNTQYFPIGTVTTTNIAATSGTGNITWYSDAALTMPLTVVTPPSPTLAELGVSTATSGTFTIYLTETNICQSTATILTVIICPNVSISVPTLNALCVGDSNYTNLGNIVINEGCLNRFPSGTGQTLILSMPTSIELQSSTGTLSFGSVGSFFTNSLIFVSNNAIFISFDAAVGSLNEANTITISGLRARATSTVTNVNMTRTGGNTIIPNVANGSIFATFSTASAPSSPAITAGNAQSFCRGTVGTTSIAATTGAGTIEWFSDLALTNSLGTGTSRTLTQLGINTNNVGTTPIYVVSKVGGCNSSIVTLNITINDTPVVVLSSNSPNNKICVEQTILFTASGSAGVQYSFDLQLSGISQTGYPTAFSATTTNTIPNTLVVNDNYVMIVTSRNANNCTSTTQIAFQIKALPVVTFTMTNTNFQITTSTPVSLNSAGSAVSPAGGVFSGAGVTGTNFFPNAAVVGGNTLTYTFTSVDGCTVSASVLVTVNNSGFIIPSSFCNDGAETSALVRNDVSPACITQSVITTSPISGTDPVINTAGVFTFRPNNVVIPTGQDFIQWTGAIFFNPASNGYPGLPCPDYGFAISTYVFRTPAPVITGLSAVCDGQLSVTYSVPSVPNNTYIWNVTGGAISGSNSGNSIVVNWGSAGTGTVSVSQTANYTTPVSTSCSRSASTNVTINPLPNPVIVADVSASSCENTTGNIYSVTNTIGNTYLWSISGGIITSGQGTNSIQVTWGSAGAGVINVIETITATNCNRSNTLLRTILPKPNPIIPNVNTSVCAGQNGVTYTMPANGSTYSWTVVGGTIASGGTTNVVTINWGIANPNASVSVQETAANGCISSSTRAVVVNAIPVPPIIGSFAICANSTGNIYSTSGSGSFVWSITGGTITAGQNTNQITVSWGTAGTGNLSVTQTDVNSCVGISNQAVTINALPTPTIVGNASVCANKLAEPYNVTNNSNHSYSWNVTGGSISAGQGTNAVTIDWSSVASGTIQLTETNTLTNCVTITSRTITINPLPTPAITGTFNVCALSIQNYQVTNSAGQNYVWNVVGGVIMSGQGTNQISVNWGSNPAGAKVEVTQTNTLLTPNCSRLDVRNIIILPLPTPSISGSAACETSTGNIYSTPFVTLNTYSWTITGGTITSPANQSQITVTWGVAGTGTLTVVQTDPNNCSNTTTQNYIINPLPTPVVTVTNNVVCAFSTAKTYSTPNVIGNVYIWDVTGGVITSGQNTNAITVNWGVSGAGIVKVTERITATTCTRIATQNITINPLPTPSIVGGVVGTNNVCATITYSYQTNNVVGHTYNWIVTGGTFIGQNTNQISITWNSNTTVGKIELTETNSSTGCLQYINRDIVILPLPAPSIVGIGEVCEDNEYVYSTTAVAGHTYIWEVGNGTITAGTGTNLIRVKWDNVSNAEYVRLTQTSSNTTPSCSRTVEIPVIVNPVPYNVITIANTCHGETTTFTPSTTQPNWIWEWVFPDNTTASIPNPTRQFADPGTFVVKLKVTNQFNCIYEQNTIPLAINPVPVADFRFLGTCLGGTTQFTNLSTTSTVNASVINQWSWDFGDGSPLIVGNFPNPTKTYTNPGVYNVVLTVRTNKNCSHTVTKKVSIFPFFSPTDLTPYTQDFQGTNHGWIAGTDNIAVPHTWTLGVPATGRTIPASVGRVWSTGLTANYTNNQKSYVESPCFSLLNLDKPMIVIKLWMDADQGADGANLLYSFDDGQTWKVVGNVGDGLNWYDTNNILGSPAGDVVNPQRKGWTGKYGQWKEARFALDIIKGEVGANPVRFRIAFGSNSDNPIGQTLDGIAFDDVYVGNRKAKLLLEYFTSTNAAAATENNFINSFPTIQQLELVVMQYFTDFLGADPLYNQNPHDATGRASFNEISRAPRAAIDGDGGPDQPFSIWGPQKYSQLALLPAPMKVRISFPPPTNGNLNVRAEVEALDEYTKPVVFHVGLVEKEVTSTQLGLPGNIVYKNVVRKMLPTVAGTYIKRNWAVGDTEVLNFSIPLYATNQNNPNIPFFYDWNNLIVTAFIQDDVSYDVLDAEKASPTTLPPLISGLAEEEQGKCWIYPNPTSDEVFIGFEKEATIDYEYEILNLQGQKILIGKIAQGEKGAKVDIKKLAKGMYMVKIIQPKSKTTWLNKLIVH